MEVGRGSLGPAAGPERRLGPRALDPGERRMGLGERRVECRRDPPVSLGAAAAPGCAGAEPERGARPGGPGRADALRSGALRRRAIWPERAGADNLPGATEIYYPPIDYSATYPGY